MFGELFEWGGELARELPARLLEEFEILFEDCLLLVALLKGMDCFYNLLLLAMTYELVPETILLLTPTLCVLCCSTL